MVKPAPAAVAKLTSRGMVFGAQPKPIKKGPRKDHGKPDRGGNQDGE